MPDLEAAVKFYVEVLGWHLIMEPTDGVEDESAIGEMGIDVFGPGGRKALSHDWHGKPVQQYPGNIQPSL